MSFGPRCLPGVSLSRSADSNGQNGKPKASKRERTRYKHNPNGAKTKRKALLKNPKENPVKTSLGRLGRQLSGEGLPSVDRALGSIPDTGKTKQANENCSKRQGVVKSFRTRPLVSLQTRTNCKHFTLPLLCDPEQVTPPL